MLDPDDWALWRSYMTMSAHLERALERQTQRDAGLSQADYAVLHVLAPAAEKRRRSGELVELLAWEKSRVSHQLSRMESRGLIERTPCEDDLRGTWVAVTAEGRRAFLRATRGHGQLIRELFLDGLTDAERAALESIVARVAARLDVSSAS